MVKKGASNKESRGSPKPRRNDQGVVDVPIIQESDKFSFSADDVVDEGLHESSGSDADEEESKDDDKSEDTEDGSEDDEDTDVIRAIADFHEAIR
jgi:hypothetical protein